MPKPKNDCQKRLTATRAVSGFDRSRRATAPGTGGRRRSGPPSAAGIPGVDLFAGRIVGAALEHEGVALRAVGHHHHGRDLVVEASRSACAVRARAPANLVARAFQKCASSFGCCALLAERGCRDLRDSARSPPTAAASSGVERALVDARVADAAVEFQTAARARRGSACPSCGTARCSDRTESASSRGSPSM